MQQRRGNRVDLPQPLRPGEIGLASDSKEVFIGLDPAIGVTKQNANGVNINNIVGGYSFAEGYLNNNIIRLILPSKRLNGFTSNSSVYTPESSSNQTHNKTVFRSGLTIANVFDGDAFQSSDITVTKNGALLSTDATRSTANLLTNEYLLSADSTLNTANHTITFGTPATGSDDYTITYYDNADVIAALVDSGNIGSTDVQGFYQQFFVGTNIPDRRKLNNAYILADHVTGTAFIGLEDKHLEVVAYSGTVSSHTSFSLSGTLSVTRSAGSNLSLALSSFTTLSSVVTAINNAASTSWLKAGQEDGVSDKWYLYSTDGSDFEIVSEDTNNKLNISLRNYTKAGDSIKGKLESWVHGAVASTSFNMFTSAQIKGSLFDSSATNIENYANVDASSDLLSITFTGNKEAENFSYIANRLYFANANADVTGLTNIKSNQRLLTLDDYDVLLSGSADAAYTAQSVTVPAGGNATIDTFDSTVYDSAVIEYSVKSAGNSGDVYSRTGTLHVTGDADIDDAAVADSGVILEENFSGALTLTASMSSDIISVTATNTLQANSAQRSAVVKFITRKWLG
tara:strand:+ start:2631 stop:4340 length:1710 start_codon:yes stop_codon:yes gene_type:complete